MAKGVFRQGPNFFIGDSKRPAAWVEVKFDPDMRFEVVCQYGTGGAEQMIEHGQAVVSAGNYAKLCVDLFRGATYLEILARWENMPRET